MDDPYSNLNPMEPASQYPHMTEEEQSNQELQREIQFVHLEIRQQPKCARVAIGKDKDRKPIDPPPMVQLQLAKEHDPTERYIHSPYYFATCTLLPPKESATDKLAASLGGTLVSSLHRLKDINNKEGAFFIFPDLSVKVEGQYRLQFSLFQMRESKGLGAYFHTCNFIKAIESDVFTVYSTKNWPGMEASTFLTRSFSDQGVRLRIRKEPRTLLRKRGPASNDYQPRHYNTQTRRETAADAEGSQERRSGPEASVSPPLSRRVEQYSSTPRRPEPSQIITPPESRQADQYYTPTGPYDPRPSSDGGGDEQPSKRPRTGSGQYSNQVQPAPAFGQQQTPANSQYAGTYMLQQQYPPVSAMSYQQPGYSYTQPQLPSSSPLYYSQQYGRAPENPASYQQNARLPSPSQPMLPQLQMRPFQPQAGFTSMNSMVSPTQQRIGSDDFGANYSPQNATAYGSAAMGPPLASHSGASGVSGGYSISPATSIAHRYALPHRTSVDEYQAGGLPAQHIQRSSSMSSNWDEGYRSGTMAPATLPSNTENQYPN